MPTGKSAFKDALKEHFENPMGKESDAIDVIGEAVTSYMMTCKIVGTSPSSAARNLVLTKVKQALSGMSVPTESVPNPFIVKLKNAIVEGGDPITKDPEIVAVAAAVVGAGPEFVFSPGLTPDQAALEISNKSDAAIKLWTATPTAGGSPVPWA